MTAVLEADVTAEERSAAVTLADRALIAARGDQDAAKAITLEALKALGLVPYEHKPPRGPRGITRLTTNYSRPWRTT